MSTLKELIDIVSNKKEALYLTHDNKVTTLCEGKLSLSVAQEFVGGLVELTYITDDVLMLCNEEGLIQNLPFNKLATAVYQKYVSSDGHIVGNVILCHTSPHFTI
jgi:hypothetical protein